MREFELPSTGGGMLRCGLWAPRTPNPEAVVQLVHGIAEHIGRYEEFASFLAAQGFLVVAGDHMGHGKSVSDGEAPGFFPSGWLGAVDDVIALLARVREELPNTPRFLLGHSMGSFLSRTLLYRCPDAGLRGVLLSGTGWQSGLTLRLGLRLCAREERRAGTRGVSDMLQNAVFGRYNRRFRPNRTAHDWICSDPAVVDAYCADPLCGFPVTVGLMRDLLEGIMMNQRKENLQKMPKDLPVLLFSGARDPVGGMGRGVARTARAFREAGMRNVSVCLYPEGRHEMLNEKNRDRVFADVLAWMKARLTWRGTV